MPEQQQINPQIVQLLVLINRLQLKAFNAPNKEALGFIIVNDTHQVFRYSRAFLWEYDEGGFKLTAISGQHKVNKESEFYQKTKRLIAYLNKPEEAQQLSAESFSGEHQTWNELFPQKDQTSYWVPIKVGDQLRLGLWLDIPSGPQEKSHNPKEEIDFLSKTLTPGYAAAWAKFDQAKLIKPFMKQKRFWLWAGVATLILLFGIRVPLRVAAPCEIVPETPVVIAAPLDGIIEQVVVKPGQNVEKGELLFVYDKTVPLQELKAAREEVEIAQAEASRAETLGLNDPKSLAELEVLRLKLQREQITLELAEIQSGKLDVKAPSPGIVVIDYPEEWSGKPVKQGEKVMALSDPLRTKVKMWVPVSDNVEIDPEKPVSIILNVAPERTLQAKLDYISFESRLGEEEIPAFVAIALWDEQPEDVKLGLKGTAILHGQRVSLFYFIARKPWSAFRRYTGL